MLRQPIQRHGDTKIGVRVRQPMSEPCPNCGSARRIYLSGVSEYVCGTQIHDEYGVTYEATACELIRSLREELAKAKATLKEHELVCYGAMERGRDAERDQIADWIENTIRKLRLVGLISVAESYEQVLTALRNNRHRSNEHRSNG